jgi:hypothetical protein
MWSIPSAVDRETGMSTTPPDPYTPGAVPSQPEQPTPPAGYAQPAPGAAQPMPATGQPSPPPGYGTPYGAPPPTKTDGVSIAALVTGLLGMALIAVVLGIVGVVRTKRPELTGRGMAIAGIVLGTLGTLAWAAVIGFVVIAVNNEDFQDAFTEGFQESYQQGLQEGMGLDYGEGECFDLPYESVDLEDITATDCGGEHTSEVIGVHLLDGGEYPGTAEMEQSFEELCLASFESYVGVPYEESALTMYPITPTEATWAFGDRQILCVVEDAEGIPLTGSVAGSGV